MNRSLASISFFRRLGFTALLGACAACAGCSKEQMSDGSLAETCDHSMPATGARQHVQHPEKPSQCKVVVMSCNACVYDGDGTFEYVETESCGMCVQTSF